MVGWVIGDSFCRSSHFQIVDRGELKDELCILQGLVETKENMMQAMREEARRNANLLLSAAKTRDVKNVYLTLC
jgi:hypothetical protein